MIIGITTTFNSSDEFERVNVEYIKRITNAGATPILLTPIPGGYEANINHAKQIFDVVDGVLLTGGGDIHPRHYSKDDENIVDIPTPIVTPFLETPDRRAVLDMREIDAPDDILPVLETALALNDNRDGLELELARLCHKSEKPILGICRGMQVLNVALGGTLHRDLLECGVTKTSHFQSKPYSNTCAEVTVKPDSKLAEILPENIPIPVNSIHHQGVNSPGSGLSISAYGTDGVIEAIEDTSLPFYIGVQWHPECLDAQSAIFEQFIKACRRS